MPGNCAKGTAIASWMLRPPADSMRPSGNGSSTATRTRRRVSRRTGSHPRQRNLQDTPLRRGVPRRVERPLADPHRRAPHHRGTILRVSRPLPLCSKERTGRSRSAPDRRSRAPRSSPRSSWSGHTLDGACATAGDVRSVIGLDNARERARVLLTPGRGARNRTLDGSGCAICGMQPTSDGQLTARPNPRRGALPLPNRRTPRSRPRPGLPTGRARPGRETRGTPARRSSR